MITIVRRDDSARCKPRAADNAKPRPPLLECGPTHVQAGLKAHALAVCGPEDTEQPNTGVDHERPPLERSTRSPDD
jgi:hypothetical protein